MDSDAKYNLALERLVPVFGQKYQVGDLLILEGAKDPRIFFIVEGMVNVFIGEETEKHALRILENGDILGEMSILDNFPRSASAEAMTETQAIVLNREQFEDLIQKYPVLAMKFIEMMGRRMRKMDTQHKSAIRYRGTKKN